MKKQSKDRFAIFPYVPLKRILALIGVILLIGLYLSTLYCALSANENFMDMLLASIYATVIIPILLWAYSFVYKLIKEHFSKTE